MAGNLQRQAMATIIGPELRDEPIKLIPFDPVNHSPKFKIIASSPETWEHLPVGPYESEADFADNYFQRHPSDPERATFAIIHTATSADDAQTAKDGGEVAGMVSLVQAPRQPNRAAIQDLILLPAFRKQGLAIKAGRLMLEYGLTPAAAGGLGLIEMHWECSTANDAARRAAIRLRLLENRIVEYEQKIDNGVARGKVGNGKPGVRGTNEGDVWIDMVPFFMTMRVWERQCEENEMEDEEEEIIDSEEEEEDIMDEGFDENDDDEDDDDEMDMGDDDDVVIVKEVKKETKTVPSINQSLERFNLGEQ